MRAGPSARYGGAVQCGVYDVHAASQAFHTDACFNAHAYRVPKAPLPTNVLRARAVNALTTHHSR